MNPAEVLEGFLVGLGVRSTLSDSIAPPSDGEIIRMHIHTSNIRLWEREDILCSALSELAEAISSRSRAPVFYRLIIPARGVDLAASHHSDMCWMRELVSTRIPFGCNCRRFDVAFKEKARAATV